MEGDEADTLATLRERRASIFDPVIRSHGGRIVKLMGDGVLVEFASAVKAVEGALELQRRMEEANGPLPASRRMDFRIGINIGDVIGEGEDIYGEGVNVAARLEALAESGGTCISAKVYEEVFGKLACDFEDLGEHAVKNISRPVRVYRLRPAGAAKVHASARPALPIPEKPSIAVLPFQNMSGDPEQEYFADGVVEDITTALSRLRWLFVIARNSSFTYRGRAVDVRQVGRELGVRYILEGSVRRVGARVRITGQLIDAATGAHLWADRFDGGVEDVFDLQDKVTASVVGAIAPRLEQAEIERAKRKPTENLDAYDYFLRGMAAFHQFSRGANVEALAMFSRAIELDPDYASAYGMAARCYLQRKGFGWVGDLGPDAAEAERLARRAADLGRDDAAALCNAGFTLIVVVGKLEEGAALIERSIALNPNLAWTLHFSALAKALLGEPEVALEQAERAMRLSPQDPQMFAMRAAAGVAHFVAGRTEEALLGAEAALREQPNFLVGMSLAAASGGLAGRLDEAGRAMAHLRQLNPELGMSSVQELLPFRRPQDFERWAEGLRRAGLPG
jgi:TolB-like protein